MPAAVIAARVPAVRLLAELVLLLNLGPAEAIEEAARRVGRPDIAPQLMKVCRRESRCEAIGVHEVDARPEASSYRGQVRLGHLDESCQPRGDWKRWGTRGMMGLNAADHWQWLPECYEPEMLDTPIVSAMIAARKYLKHCDKRNRTSSWCPTRKRYRAPRRKPTPVEPPESAPPPVVAWYVQRP